MSKKKKELVDDEKTLEDVEKDQVENDEDDKIDSGKEKTSEEIDEEDDAKRGPMPQPPKKKQRGEDSKAKQYVDDVIAETKKVTWPGREEVLKWSLIVLATIAFFTLFTFLVDNFIASPIVYGISGFSTGEGFGRKAIALTVAFFLSGIGTVIGVMLHSGGDQNGLSEGLASSLTGGSAVAEKNLDRITIVLALIFTLSCVFMMVWFPLGSIVQS